MTISQEQSIEGYKGHIWNSILRNLPIGSLITVNNECFLGFYNKSNKVKHYFLSDLGNITTYYIEHKNDYWYYSIIYMIDILL